MMRNSMTAVLERDGITGPVYVTEPYEVAWATEARWFVRTLAIPEQVERVDLAVQLSPDGLHWCDIDGEAPSIGEPGVITWTTQEFGGWLRLKARVTGDDPDASVQALIYLALKG
jgi:hypothetical protein